jgi:hypothetical protein
VSHDDRRAVGHLAEGATGKFSEYAGSFYGVGVGKGAFSPGWGQNFSSPYGENAYSVIYLMHCLYFEMKKGPGLLALSR